MPAMSMGPPPPPPGSAPPPGPPSDRPYQQPYQQPYQSPYGGYAAREHPQGTTILVLGVLSIVLGLSCGVGFLIGPVAWVMGNNAVAEIDADPAAYTNRGMVQAGRICGIVASALLALAVVVVIVVAIAAAASST
jgi:uncharacterized Tic20 family protein